MERWRNTVLVEFWISRPTKTLYELIIRYKYTDETNVRLQISFAQFIVRQIAAAMNRILHLSRGSHVKIKLF